jgi:hypothetical protein
MTKASFRLLGERTSEKDGKRYLQYMKHLRDSKDLPSNPHPTSGVAVRRAFSLNLLLFGGAYDGN